MPSQSETRPPIFGVFITNVWEQFQGLPRVESTVKVVTGTLPRKHSWFLSA
ncbi:hypothetical protein AXX17_AT3G01280 [Arabidopsis thaliana]|uniref:Uncharacterized protein n=1 Tax=Arabidopsis thaliana TaxID=3702 RepID=A0A178V7K3_ARATH|nr:hypothetical protein AXX17_AT3G01280 [Arabidopsis thaliana]